MLLKYTNMYVFPSKMVRVSFIIILQNAQKIGIHYHEWAVVVSNILLSHTISKILIFIRYTVVYSMFKNGA